MTYAVSDIHGCYDEYKRLLEEIHFGEQDTLYVLGDVLDRGPSGFQILLDIASSPNVLMLKGNHEKMALDALTAKEFDDIDLWFYNGGETSLNDFLDLGKEDADRALRGESLSLSGLADEYGVSGKSVARTLGDIKAFLADHRDLIGNTELVYSRQDNCYHLNVDGFLTNKKLFALVAVMLGSRAFSKTEVLALIDKLKGFTTTEDRPKLTEMIRKEVYHYSEVKHDCDSVQDLLWDITNCIYDKNEISIDYYRSDRAYVTHRVRPVAVFFTDYYFYLLAFLVDKETEGPTYFRLDRIRNMTVHRKKFDLSQIPDFDEGLLRKRSLFMWPGKLRKIRFEYTGPSVQAVLDKIPTAHIIERSNEKYLLEAEVYGEGIKMWPLSQGGWVKVISPEEFVGEIRDELVKMASYY